MVLHERRVPQNVCPLGPVLGASNPALGVGNAWGRGVHHFQMWGGTKPEVMLSSATAQWHCGDLLVQMVGKNRFQLSQDEGGNAGCRVPGQSDPPTHN